jgi:SAM-dependent methyltransferase
MLADERTQDKSVLRLIPVQAEQPALGNVLAELQARWSAYAASDVDTVISPNDDMLIGEKSEQYFQVGRSAVELIVEAMLLARRTAFPTILDMPCGGGRVTRHLVKLFPDAKIFASDVEKNKQRDVVTQFGVEGIDIAADFSQPSSQKYDLIFVGSLLTHLKEGMFLRVLDYCIDALRPGGVLIATTAGRTVMNSRVRRAKRIGQPHFNPAKFQNFEHMFFGDDTPSSRYGGVVYASGFAPVSWAARQVEARNDARWLANKEAGWARAQDAMIIQKLPLE